MNERVIRVQGRATVKATPDEAILSFTVSASDPDYAQAINRLNQRVEALRQDLKAVGIERTELKTNRFDVQVTYKTVNKQTVFDCYVATHGLALHLPMQKEFLDRVLTAMGRSVGRPKFDLSFGVKDEPPLRQKALEEAVLAARRNAETLTRAAGVKLGQLLRIEYGWAEVRFSSPGSYTLQEGVCEMAVADITPGDVEGEDSVTLVWEMA